ncbi:MAG: hypothetical protein JWQ23_1331, partial [Herminiimonas sp.]|nr:hypothetical protein [Herminiimonas sp.]
MGINNNTHCLPLSRQRSSLSFLTKNLRITPATLLWPLVCICLGVALWHFTLTKADTDRALIKENAFIHATSLSKAYSEQLSHSLRQVDQITLSLKYNWEDSSDAQRLEKQFQKGLYPPAGLLFATLADRNGKMLSSTLGVENRVNISGSDYFKAHKTGKATGLLISKPAPGMRVNTVFVRFSRRLDTASGAFDGVVIVAVEPTYFASFYDESILSKSGFLSVADKDGVVLASKKGSDLQSRSAIFRNPPQFATDNGAILMPAEKFSDNEPRVIAWHKLKSYPLTAMVGLSEKEFFSSHQAIERDNRNIAIAGSMALFLFALLGVYFSSRLAWRKQQAEDVRNTYRLAVDGAREGFYMVRALYDEQGTLIDFLIEDCNERGAELVGHDKEALVGTRFLALYSGENAHHVLRMFAIAMDTGFYEDEVRVSPKSPLKAAWLYRRLVRSGAGLAMTVRDISDVKAHEQALANLANLDTLTGLPNRYWLMSFLPTALDAARKSNGKLALLFVDLDDFKNINDSLGHGAGDELLKAAAARLKSLVRASDHVVRLGGDEFTIILEQIDSGEDVSRVTKLLIRALAEPFRLFGEGRHLVRASIGISMFPQDGEDTETLLKHADIAMYAAKGGGKARYEFYNSRLSDRLLLRLDKEQALRQAIERDEFEVYYQPRVDTFTGDLCGLEALIRWIHPERGLLLPEEFIQVAEDTGLILQIGELVIDKTIGQIAHWQEQGLPVVPVSINVSALQF